MTLSIDEVRSIRFPMARKPNEDGYRASSVDKFMDELEISYASLVEENEKLGKNTAPAGAPAVDDKQLAELKDKNEHLSSDVKRLTTENEQLRSQLDQLRSAGDKSSAASEQVTAENQQLRSTVDQLRAELEAAQGEASQARAQLKSVQSAPAAPVAAAAPEAAKTPAAATDGAPQHIVVTAADEAGPWAARLLEMSTKEADQLVSEAKEHAQKLRTEAQTETEKMHTDAKAKADSMVEDATQKAARLDYESRNNADRITHEAQRRADALDGEVAAKREELFHQLEGERDNLTERVEQLRGFENDYRTKIISHLQGQLSSLKNLSLTPKDENGTPRIDALLSENKS
ncbi:DivIVA domain-containing protein [Propionibacterium sp.]|uniref:DivIVA domain-containing protein n=1 Tax=Propionibacterium sp. TaxID=1977903 RepID=UPI0039ED3BAD